MIQLFILQVTMVPIPFCGRTADTLSQTTDTAYQVLLSGNDVYVSGVIQKTGIPGPTTGQYVYWENGTSNNIDSLGNADYPSSIAVSGADAYYANTWSAWKNGAVFPLPGIATIQRFPRAQSKLLLRVAPIYILQERTVIQMLWIGKIL